MKRGTLEHPKLNDLASMLGVRRHVAVGLLEMMWHFCARYAPRGDIGRFSNCRIAASLDWPGKHAERLISCLVDTRWLDKDDEHRLTVHDWHDHSDGTCDKFLSDNGLNYIDGRTPRRKLKQDDGQSRDADGQSRDADGQSRDADGQSRVTRARGQNQNQNQNQNQRGHPQFLRLLEAANGNLGAVTWESWVTLLRSRGLEEATSGMTEEQVVTEILPSVESAPWAVVERQGAGRWLGWQLDDVVKRMGGKKNGAPDGQKTEPPVQIPSEAM